MVTIGTFYFFIFLFFYLNNSLHLLQELELIEGAIGIYFMTW